MKPKAIFAGIFLSIIFVHCSNMKQDDFPVLQGPYLGQKPPGKIPELFAPGVVTSPFDEAYPSFTKDGKEFYFHCHNKGGWFFTDRKRGIWSQPQIVPFSKEYKFSEAMITPDGNTLLFCSSYSSTETESPDNLNLWRIKKSEGKWQKPMPFGTKINTEYHEAYPSMSSSGDLYFFRDLGGENDGSDIFVSRNRNNQYLPPKNLGPAINSSKHECDPYVAPDENYLVFCVRDRNDGFGKNDLCISFKNPDGTWSKSINMGKKFNTEAEEITPYITPDGKYIFFSSNRSGNYDIYWVDVKIIEELKPDEFN